VLGGGVRGGRVPRILAGAEDARSAAWAAGGTSSEDPIQPRTGIGKGQGGKMVDGGWAVGERYAVGVIRSAEGPGVADPGG